MKLILIRIIVGLKNEWFFEIVTVVGGYSELIFERMENCHFHKGSFAL